MPLERETEPSQWGALLFEDATGMKEEWGERIMILFVSFIAGGFFIMVGFFQGLNDGLRIVCIGGGLSLIGIMAGTHKLYPPTPFQVYENGIRFTGNRNRLLFFRDINHIKVLEFGDLEIRAKGGTRYLIAERPEEVTGMERIQDIGTASRLIIKRMRACNARRNQYYIVRDLYRIKWSKEAFHKLKLRWGPGSEKNDAWGEIADRVAAAGRRRVELADVNRMIEEISCRRNS